jgi:FKBP-type peptidyl-prolyl cis-trans isomerase (trigger factor)
MLFSRRLAHSKRKTAREVLQDMLQDDAAAELVEDFLLSALMDCAKARPLAAAAHIDNLLGRMAERYGNEYADKKQAEYIDKGLPEELL